MKNQRAKSSLYLIISVVFALHVPKTVSAETPVPITDKWKIVVLTAFPDVNAKLAALYNTNVIPHNFKYKDDSTFLDLDILSAPQALKQPFSWIVRFPSCKGIMINKGITYHLEGGIDFMTNDSNMVATHGTDTLSKDFIISLNLARPRLVTANFNLDAEELSIWKDFFMNVEFAEAFDKTMYNYFSDEEHKRGINFGSVNLGQLGSLLKINTFNWGYKMGSTPGIARVDNLLAIEVGLDGWETPKNNALPDDPQALPTNCEAVIHINYEVVLKRMILPKLSALLGNSITETDFKTKDNNSIVGDKDFEFKVYEKDEHGNDLLDKNGNKKETATIKIKKDKFILKYEKDNKAIITLDGNVCPHKTPGSWYPFKLEASIQFELKKDENNHSYFGTTATIDKFKVSKSDGTKAGIGVGTIVPLFYGAAGWIVAAGVAIGGTLTSDYIKHKIRDVLLKELDKGVIKINDVKISNDAFEIIELKSGIGYDMIIGGNINTK